MRELPPVYYNPVTCFTLTHGSTARMRHSSVCVTAFAVAGSTSLPRDGAVRIRLYSGNRDQPRRDSARDKLLLQDSAQRRATRACYRLGRARSLLLLPQLTAHVVSSCCMALRTSSCRLVASAFVFIAFWADYVYVAVMFSLLRHATRFGLQLERCHGAILQAYKLT